MIVMRSLILKPSYPIIWFQYCTIYESHAIIDNLKKEIESKIDIIEKAIIHVDPM